MISSKGSNGLPGIVDVVDSEDARYSPPNQDWRRENWTLQCQLAETQHTLHQVRAELDRMIESRSWRLTRFLRNGLDGLRRLRSGVTVQQAGPPRLRSVTEFAEARPRPEQHRLLLVDVTELAIENLQGGIQHTVKGILSEWLLSPPAGWQVVPVQLTREGTYVSASGDLRHLFGSFTDPHAGRQIDVGRGDVFLGLDLLRDHAGTFRVALEKLRSKQVHVEIVVYDLLPVDLPHCVPGYISESFLEWLAAVGDLADGVACISQAVAQRFAAWLSARDGRKAGISISSFRLGAPAPASVNAGRRARRLDGASFLMVGTVEPRKGYVDALNAFERIWSTAEGADVTLTIVGRYGWGLPEFLARLESHPQMGRRLFWLRRATDEDVQACYDTADALLFCSYGEGFGLPIVEAAQHGLPLILRDLPEFREVAGDGAYFFRSQADEGIQAAIGHWRELMRAGQAPMPRDDIAITWEQSADQLLVAVGSNLDAG
jgi:glycosyltransferase involved in cell wall biosynthesis